MADEKKPGLFGRFFGGKPAEEKPAPEPAPEIEAELPPPAEAFVPDTAPVILSPEVEEDESDALAPEVEVPREATGWFVRLRKGLSRTSEKLGSGISDLFTKSKFDAATLDELEDLLIQADLGVDTAMRISQEVGRQRHE